MILISYLISHVIFFCLFFKENVRDLRPFFFLPRQLTRKSWQWNDDKVSLGDLKQEQKDMRVVDQFPSHNKSFTTRLSKVPRTKAIESDFNCVSSCLFSSAPVNSCLHSQYFFNYFLCPTLRAPIGGAVFPVLCIWNIKKVCPESIGLTQNFGHHTTLHLPTSTEDISASTHSISSHYLN